MAQSPSRTVSPSAPVSDADPCPCGAGAAFGACCGPKIAGRVPAPTAEALMRSRFTAFVVDDMGYIARSWASETRPPLDANGEVIEEDAGEIGAGLVAWTGLEILETTGGGPDDETGTVTFAAEGRHGGRGFIHRETSHFRREDGRWVYLDGDIAPAEAIAQTPVRVTKIGRNEPCPCGSGKKYKKCCGA